MRRHRLAFAPVLLIALAVLILPGRHYVMVRDIAAMPAVREGQAAAKAKDGSFPFPKLVLQITVDQLRGDLPRRYQDRFDDGGFRYLMEKGTWYVAAHHPHSHTETIVGHTTLATGAYPSVHGMIANSWYDRTTGQPQSCIEDPPLDAINQEVRVGLRRLPDPASVVTFVAFGRNPILGEDPKKSKGASPKLIMTTTLGDELTNSTAGRAKVFSVASKDRAAVAMGGHTGKAFWYSDKNGHFVTSTYYYEAYPKWVTAWNDKRHADTYGGTKWELLKDPSTYVFLRNLNEYPRDTPPEINMTALENVYRFGRTFPHTLAPTGPGLYQGLTLAPQSDELTLNFAMTLIQQEELGKHGVPDYLSVGFSSTDIIAHWFGPSSLESEDNVLRLDRTLAKLFSFIEQEVGLDNTLIVLAGDHGGPELPEYLEQWKVNTGRVDSGQIESVAKQALKQRYDRDDLLLNYSHPNIYLNHKAIADHGLELAEVGRVAAAAIEHIDGVALTISVGGQNLGQEVNEEIFNQIRRNHHPKRSGDVYVVQDPQWQVNRKPASGEGSTELILLQHGSPWAYDTYVPIVFVGAKTPAALVSRRVYTVDVAPTLSAILKTNVPSGAYGEPLTEVLGTR